MRQRRRLRISRSYRCFSGVFSVVSAVAIASTSTDVAYTEEPIVLAISNFAFIDPSGEIRDQRADHARRLTALGATLEDALSTSNKVNIVPLACHGEECTAMAAGLETLSLEAKSAGAQYLLIGEVRKMSTLVGGLKFAVLDLATNRPTCDRFLSYRGDTDEAWERAARYAVSEIKNHCLPT